MAEPTLKDVLKAISEMRGDVARLEKGQARLETAQARLETGQARLETGQAGIRTEMNARFDRVDSQLKELDKDLDGHMDVHAELERDVEAVKGRPLRTAARARRGSRKRPAK